MSASRIRALAGITPILVTPYDEDDRIAFDDIVRQVDHLATMGVAAVGVGYGSDILRLTDAERERLVPVVSYAAAGRVPVLAAAGGNSTRSALDRALAMRAAGADVLMVTPPGAVGAPGPRDILDYFATVAAETAARIVVQDAPDVTGTTMSAGLLAEIARTISGVAAIKIESLPPAPKVGELAALDHGSAAVLGGAGGIDFYHELERGADGTIPGVAMAELFVAIHARHRAGDRDGARRLFNRYLPLLMLATRGGDAFFAVQMTILARRGIIRRTAIRRPSSIDSGLAGELVVLLEELDLATPDA
jgi:4-hydroxy-tetrahydrodipicolinate synthase